MDELALWSDGRGWWVGERRGPLAVVVKVGSAIDPGWAADGGGGAGWDEVLLSGVVREPAGDWVVQADCGVEAEAA